MWRYTSVAGYPSHTGLGRQHQGFGLRPAGVDGLIMPPTHPPRARWLALDRADPRPRWTRARRTRRYLWPEPHPRRRPQTPEHPPRPPASEHHKEVFTHAKIHPTRAGLAVRATSARGAADRAGRVASVYEERVRKPPGGAKKGPSCPIWVDHGGWPTLFWQKRRGI